MTNALKQLWKNVKEKAIFDMIRNFLFHRVNSNRDPLWDPMSPDLFEKCIRYIKKNYEIKLFEELMNSKDLSKNKNFATIMFDDGYKDNYDIALPILEKYNVKASFYIVTDCIENNVLTWTHKLEYCFQKMKLKEIRLDFEFLPPKSCEWSFILGKLNILTLNLLSFLLDFSKIIFFFLDLSIYIIK